MLTASTNPIQLVAINMEATDNINMIFNDLNNIKNSLILPIKKITTNKKINDQTPLWLAISNAGINFISLNIKGWGMPQKVEAKDVKKTPLIKGLFFNFMKDLVESFYY